jgi:hypothetical protein
MKQPNENNGARTVIIGSADLTSGYRIKRLDDFVFRCRTPEELGRSSSADRCFKIVRCQIVCDSGIQPKDVNLHMTLASTMSSQQNYTVCPCNLTFQNRLCYPINDSSTDDWFDIYFTDGYGLPVRVETFTLYLNMNF